MPERRYSKYKLKDVWSKLTAHQKELGIEVLPDTAMHRSVSLLRIVKGQDGQERRERYNAVLLARSSEWYLYSLNCFAFRHAITCVVAGTHDSCVDVPVLAMDTMRWYTPKMVRDDFGPLQPKFDEHKRPLPDLFEQKRKTQYGHNMLIGALMQQRKDASERLNTFKPSTRMRIEAELRMLENRRVGHPLELPEIGYQRERHTLASEQKEKEGL